MIYNSIKFEKLSFWEQYYKDPLDGIPNQSGIYYWVYYPEINAVTSDENQIKLLIDKYVSKSLLFSEEAKGLYKFHAIISEQSYPINGEMFGLSHAKSLKLYNYLKTPSNRIFFAEFFKELCFTRPFYVGKANNLRSRLATQHFKSLTEVVPEIDKLTISHTDIWVGYKLVPDPSSDDVNNIFEEIFSRRIKPGLTKKPN
jgi:hypothetical protein